jgi:type VI secretion system protein ImpK
MVTTLDPPVHAVPAAARPRRGELALALQEAFTAAVRLRNRRQRVADADTFRGQIKHLLALANRDAVAAGYDPRAVKLAVYAYVAFLDESVLGSGEPGLASWPRQSLQEEVFGDHMAGETFFAHLDELLARQDSDEAADVLEVFLLCLLLGFRGRYAASDRGALDAHVRAVREKVTRIRGGREPLSPQWNLPADETAPAAGDPWVGRLWRVVAGAAALALLLFVVYTLNLGSWIAEIRALAPGVAR